MITIHNNEQLTAWLHSSGATELSKRNKFTFRTDVFSECLHRIMSKHPSMNEEQARIRACHELIKGNKLYSNNWAHLEKSVWPALKFLWAVAVLGLLAVIAAKAGTEDEVLKSLRSSPPQFGGLVIQLQNAGSTLATFGGGLVGLNCGTGMSCSFSGTTFTMTSSASGGIPSGMVAFVASGSCPAGWTELGSATNYILLTTAAAGDVGTTGGSNAYTPAGSNSTVAFTPSGTNSTSTVTPSGTLSWPAGVPTIAAGSFTQPTIAWPAGVPTIAAGVFTQPTISWPAGVPTQAADSFGTTKFTTSGSGTAAFTSETARGAISWPAGVPTNASGAFAEGALSWPAGVPTASSGAFIEGAISWPVGVPTFSGSSSTVGAQTFTGNSGTVPAETFSGTPATLQPTFLKLIGCTKT